MKELLDEALPKHIQGTPWSIDGLYEWMQGRIPLQRYKQTGHNGAIRPHGEGNYVLWSDCEAREKSLRAELDRAQAALVLIATGAWKSRVPGCPSVEVFTHQVIAGKKFPGGGMLG